MHVLTIGMILELGLGSVVDGEESRTGGRTLEQSGRQWQIVLVEADILGRTESTTPNLVGSGHFNSTGYLARLAHFDLLTLITSLH